MNRLPFFATALVAIFLMPVVIGAESGHSRADITDQTESACEMGRAYARQDFTTLDRLNAEDYVVVDERYLRPAEVDLLLGDAAKAQAKLGWLPETTLEQLVAEMVEADLVRIKQHERL